MELVAIIESYDRDSGIYLPGNWIKLAIRSRHEKQKVAVLFIRPKGDKVWPVHQRAVLVHSEMAQVDRRNRLRAFQDSDGLERRHHFFKLGVAQVTFVLARLVPQFGDNRACWSCGDRCGNSNDNRLLGELRIAPDLKLTRVDRRSQAAEQENSKEYPLHMRIERCGPLAAGQRARIEKRARPARSSVAACLSLPTNICHIAFIEIVGTKAAIQTHRGLAI